MYKLFISTYSELITIGLFKDNTLIMQKEKESEKSHSIYLVPMIDEILKENNIECQDLSEILVVNGPGSFTGIRLGVTVAKTLAYTLNIPIKTISSIEAISASIKDDNKIITISDTKGKYLGIFENNQLVNELMYLKNTDYEQYINNYNYPIYEDSKLDLQSINNYSLEIAPTPAHAVKAIYIKEIEALSGR